MKPFALLEAVLKAKVEVKLVATQVLLRILPLAVELGDIPQEKVFLSYQYQYQAKNLYRQTEIP